MKDILGLMNKAREMQAKMQEMQASLSDLEATGASGGGLVSMTLSGKGDLKRVAIDPSLMNADEVEMLEDLLVAAHNAAKAKVEEEVQKKTAELTAGLPLPPGMKLPF